MIKLIVNDNLQSELFVGCTYKVTSELLNNDSIPIIPCKAFSEGADAIGPIYHLEKDMEFTLVDIGRFKLTGKGTWYLVTCVTEQGEHFIGRIYELALAGKSIEVVSDD